MRKLKLQENHADNKTRLIFESGIVVDGIITNILRANGKVLLITFTDCTVSESNGNILIQT